MSVKWNKDVFSTRTLKRVTPRRLPLCLPELQEDQRDQGARHVPAQVRAQPERGEAGDDLSRQDCQGLGYEDVDPPTNPRECSACFCSRFADGCFVSAAAAGWLWT